VEPGVGDVEELIMSEAMALERMTQMFAELEGYLTTARVPYLAKYERESENKKKGKQLGDLDLVGIGPAPEQRLLVAECKGFGGPEDYQNWFTVYCLCELEDMVWKISSNVESVSHVRWGPEFEARKEQSTGICKPDEVWIVFPGSFFPRSDPKRFEVDDADYKPFIEEMSKAAQPMWDSWEDGRQPEYEKELLAKAEIFLGESYDVQVRLFPIHHLLHQLFVGVTRDMVQRRKRYPDTAMEMIRWMARAVWWEVLDLAEVQTEILKVWQEESATS
jgi:hypothetical protein